MNDTHTNLNSSMPCAYKHRIYSKGEFIVQTFRHFDSSRAIHIGKVSYHIYMQAYSSRGSYYQTPDNIHSVRAFLTFLNHQNMPILHAATRFVCLYDSCMFGIVNNNCILEVFFCKIFLIL